MDHVISVNYLDVQLARASAILPAGGAWDPIPLELSCPNFEHMVLYLAYTRGGAAGSFNVKIEVAHASTGAVWHQLGLYDPLDPVVAGADSQSREQREYLTYVATGAAIEYFEQAVHLFGAVERIRVIAAELGNQAAPGTLAIQAKFA
jgi:hypothetical protein